ncbi:hypothetical protein Q7P37_005037 [Cladosporium fusiforme]
MAAILSQRWTLSDIRHAGSFPQATKMLQTASVDDVVAMAVLAILSAVYLMRGTLWDRPDPYLYKMYERPQEKMGSKTVTSATRDVAERMHQVGADIVIFWGSQSGTAERFAGRLAKEVKQRFGKVALVADMSDYEPDSVARIAESKVAFFIMSTFGEGDPSDNVHDFWSWIESKRGRLLSQLRYMAFGLGNSNYKHYNAVINHVAEKVEKLGAQPLLPTGYADDVKGETEEHFLEWKDKALATLKNKLDLEEHDPIYEPSIEVVEKGTVDAASISHGVPLEQATTRAAARTISPIHALPVKSSHELFKVTDNRNCLHMEIDLSVVAGLKYKTGDHLAIWPINPDAEVAILVRSLGLAPKLQTVVTVKALEGETRLKIPESASVSAILNHYLEITAAVSRDVVSSLIEFAPNETAQHRLVNLSKDARAFSEFTHSNYVNFGRLLKYADDTAGAWSSVPLSYVVEAIPAMRPRYYSISSSSVIQPRQAAITAVVSDSPLKDSENGIPGLSTNYLLALNGSLQQAPSAHPKSMTYALDGPQNLLQNGKIHAHIRKSQFKLPTVASRPVVMVGAGTGIAPFRAFLQERATLLRMGREVGPTILFFGCRNQHHDFIYSQEIQEAVSVLGDRFKLVTAFSRPDEGTKAYVQDRVRENADELCDLMINQDTHFYICGSASMAREVSNVIAPFPSPTTEPNCTRASNVAARRGTTGFFLGARVTADESTMRNGKGCQSCRSRHVKCVTEPGSPICTRCKEGDRSCVFDSKFRFREVRHVDTASQGVRSRTHLIYEDDQLWVPTREAVGFVLEDGAGAEYGTADFIEQEDRLDQRLEVAPELDAGIVIPPRAQSVPIEPHRQERSDPTGVESHTPAVETNLSPAIATQSPAVISWHQHSDRQSEVGSRLSDAARPHTRASGVAEDYTSPASLSELSRRHESGRRLTWGTGEYDFLVGDSIEASPAGHARTPASMATIDLSHREALLIQHFIQKLAPWEVPKRAVRTPMVLYAVLAVSSRHQALVAGYDELEASYYHGQCLELVINALSQPETSYDDNLFATIICMRVYEELDEEVDDFLHLQGVGRLLNAIPTFAYSGGLAEAASWQALRQEIYASLFNKVPPSFDFGQLWILRLLHSPAAVNTDSWSELEHSIEVWDAQRSLVFRPLYAKEADPIQDQSFPIIRLTNPAQVVVALQYFNACHVLIRQHKPSDQSLSGFEAAKVRKTTERDLITALGNVIGLAESNTWVENANFTAHHMLRITGGYHISSLKQRERSIAFLRRVQDIMGFRTHSTIGLLQSQWLDLDGSVVE